ncbi:hypothetical protein ACOMHN_005238 [Nucella lapillus]
MMRRHSINKIFVEKTSDPILAFQSADDIGYSVTSPARNQNDVTMTRGFLCRCPKRWLLAFSLCFMRMCQTALRQNMGIALVCMTQTPDDDGMTSANGSLPNQTQPEATQYSFENSTEFHWSSQLEGHVLSAPYYGFFLTVPLAVYLDHVIGPCRLLTLSLGVGAVLSLLTPLLTRIHPYLLVTNRAFAGAASGMMKPAVFSLWAQWAPFTEQGILMAVDYAGSNLGGILTFFISGFLCTIPVDNGWPFIFYVVGLICLLCAVGVYLTIYDSPDLHPSASQAERELIRNKTHSADNEKRRRPPWSKVAGSHAVWAIVVAHCSHHWVHAVLVTYLPMYIHHRLRYPVAESGMLLALAFAGSMVVGVVGGAAADQLQKHLRVVHVRKIFQLAGSLGLSVPVGLVCWLDHHHPHHPHNPPTAVLALLVLAVALFNLTSLAYRINSLDIAPGYASFITSMSSTIATALSVTAPMVSAAILKSKSPEEWQRVLILVALVSLAGGIFYVIFGRGDPQPWAYANSYDVTPRERDVVRPRHCVRSLPDQFKESPGNCIILSVQRLNSIV